MTAINARIHELIAQSYYQFIDYGDAVDFHARVQEYREQLRRESTGS